MNYRPFLSLSICIIVTILILWQFDIIQFNTLKKAQKNLPKKVKKTVKFADDPELNLNLEEEFGFTPDNTQPRNFDNSAIIDQLWDNNEDTDKSNNIDSIDSIDSIDVRNKLSQVHEYIFVSNWSKVFEELGEIKKLGISHVIALPDDASIPNYSKNNLKTVAGIKSIHEIKVSLPAPGGGDMKSEFTEFKNIAQPLIDNCEKILVFCQGGETTSPLFVAGLIAEKENKDINDVISSIKKVHPVTSISPANINKI